MRWLYGEERCERARAWAALAPDGELSELERRLLRAHTRRCSACSAYADQVDAVVRLVRSQPLADPPAGICAPARSARVLRRARGPIRRRVERGAALVAAMCLGGIAISVVTTSHENAPPGSGVRLIIVPETNVPASEADDIREARRVNLLDQNYPEPYPAVKYGVQPS